MAIKFNCWEFEKCGREPGGTIADKCGTCPAAYATSINGVNGGKNGGRICWAIPGKLCKEEIKGAFAKERYSCMNCDFFQLVSKEEKIDAFDMLNPTHLQKLLLERSKEAK